MNALMNATAMRMPPRYVFWKLSCRGGQWRGMHGEQMRTDTEVDAEEDVLEDASED